MKRFDMDSWINLCRSCLSPETGVSLFDTEDNIQEKFLEVTTVEVRDDDGLPQKLCNDCFTLMTSAYQFRTQCMKMDKELRLQLEAYINENSDQFSQIETQLKATEDMTIEDIAKESMKQLESIIKSEAADSDDDYYYVVVVDDPKDDESENNNSNSMIIESIKRENEASDDIVMQNVDQSTQFENCIDSFLVSNPKIPNNVPATILENEEQEMEDHFGNVDDLSQDHSLGLTEDSQDKTNDGYSISMPKEVIKNISGSKSFIKIVTPSGAERTILVKNDDGVKYLTDAQLSKEESESLSQEEVILYEGDDASQLQILKCDGSELVIEYADDSEIATVLQQEDGTFLCDCGEQFEDFADYEKHQYKHNPAGEHLCNLCGKGFETAEVLTGHMMLHSVSGVYVTCPFCYHSIKRNNLTQHIKYVHNSKPQCEICSKTFANQNNLKRHMMIHSGVKDFECDICHKRFHQKITMQTHRLTHINPFMCSHCGLKFEDKAELTAHKSSEECSKSRISKVKEELMKTVKQEVVSNLGKLLGYACSLCKKMFSVESALEQHVENTHILETEEQQQTEKIQKKNTKKFDCRLCGKSCASQAMMVMHERVHTNERPFPCQLCSLRFKTKTHLRTHQLTHTREKKFGCSVCLKFFALKGNLVVHLRTHTGERPYVCSICGDAYIDSKYLKKHKQKKHAIDNVPWNKY